MTPTKLALIGFGNVGKAFARLLLRKRQQLIQAYGLNWRVVAIATGNHGSALDPEGIDLEAALALAESGDNLGDLSSMTPPADGSSLIRSSDAHVLVENTPVHYETGQPAIDHIQTALETGMHAITANKGPVVHAFRELTELASTHDRRFYFESAVMDGAPIFALWRQALPAADLQSFRGLLNSTTNLILTLMEKGKTFDQAVAQAQAIGIAETDPSGDTQGWDAAIKVAALVNVIMGIPLKPQQVERQGIEEISLGQVASAHQAGLRWKLICSAERTGEAVRAVVHPERIGPEDSLFNVMGTSSAVTFQSDVLGDLTLTESDPSPDTTAYGLLADLINALRSY